MPDQAKIVPLTELELILARGVEGTAILDKVTEALLGASVLVMVDVEMTPGVWTAGATPLLVTRDGGINSVPAFTHPTRMAGWAERFPSHPYVQEVSMRWLIEALGEGVGIAINLDTSLAIGIPAAKVAELKQG